MRLDVCASERHYVDHLAPIWLTLPPDLRGRWWVHRKVADHVAAAGVPRSSICVGDPPPGGLTAVASFADLRRAGRRPVVMVAHGAGQTYVDVRSGSYTGGRGRDRVVLNLVAGPHDAAQARAAQPDVPTVEVGCVKLDPWHRGERPRGAGDGTVAVSFHSDLQVCPETRTGMWHYLDAVARLSHGRRVLGHAHPRLWRRARRAYTDVGIEPVADFGDVLDRADLYVVDNSSTAYEFASTGRPVLLLNLPWYRRDVEHGLRFWSLVPGAMCDLPDDLDRTVGLALDDPDRLRDVRERSLAHVYARPDGQAAARAADAITRTLGATDGQPLRATGPPPG